MTDLERLSIAWAYIKEYAAAVVSCGLIYAGLAQILYQLNSTLTKCILRSINWVADTYFPFRILPFADVGLVPWRFQAMVIAEGLVPVALGILVGLWVNVRKQRYQVST